MEKNKLLEKRDSGKQNKTQAKQTLANPVLTA